MATSSRAIDPENPVEWFSCRHKPVLAAQAEIRSTVATTMASSCSLNFSNPVTDKRPQSSSQPFQDFSTVILSLSSRAGTSGLLAGVSNAVSNIEAPGGVGDLIGEVGARMASTGLLA